MSLYAEYIKETRGLNIVEKEWGYATLENKGSELANEILGIAKSEGCKVLTGAVTTRFKDPTSSLKFMITYGLKIDKIIQDVIFLKMEI